MYWEDTDAGGIVFYGNYLKFMERARTEWLSALGFGQESMRRAGEGMFIVAETTLRYLKPARLDDQLTVTVAVTEIGRASVTFAQEVWRADTLLTQGMVRIGWVQPVTPRDASVAQAGSVKAQRPAKGQPGGRLNRSGTLPGMVGRRSLRCATSRCARLGRAASSPRV